MKTRTMYMHTLDREPANFEDGRMYFVHSWNTGIAVVLVPTLEQIRREQQTAIRKERAAANDPTARVRINQRYDYVRVKVPA